MTDLIQDDGQKIRLLTMRDTHACSYLEGFAANSIFLDPATPPSWNQYSQLSRMGFRRSGTHYYRPHCPMCDECKSSRIVIDSFKFSSRFKRILNKAKALHVSLRPANEFVQEHYSLYERYINARHKDGDMYPPTRDQYTNFLLSHYEYAYFMEVRDEEGRLILATATDLLDDGLSAIYTYFDPEYSQLSPGTLAVLLLARMAKEKALPFVYLGYWVKNSQKMNYKTQFKPLEIFDGEMWHPLPE